MEPVKLFCSEEIKISDSLLSFYLGHIPLSAEQFLFEVDDNGSLDTKNRLHGFKVSENLIEFDKLYLGKTVVFMYFYLYVGPIQVIEHNHNDRRRLYV